jgi:hypothetical protein
MGLTIVARLTVLLAACFLPSIAYASHLSTVAFGDFSLRETAFQEDDYRFRGGWLEVRSSWGPWERAPGLARAYGRVSPSFSNRPAKTCENRLVGGVGIETFPLSLLVDRLPSVRVAAPLRAFVEYAGMVPHGTREDSWLPRHDWILGIEYWRVATTGDERTAVKPRLEIWARAGWRATGFYRHNYRSYDSALAARSGVTFLKCLDVYLVLDGRVNQWYPQYWENRVDFGVGLQWRPEVILLGMAEPLSVYAQALPWSVYLRESPDGLPQSDVVAGIRFALGWWAQ